MNYEIFLIQNNIDEINKLPNIEDLYDMDKGSLLKLKQLFDSKFPKLKSISEKEKEISERKKKFININSNSIENIDLQLEEDFSDEELQLREFKLNGNDENEIDLPRLYSFILSEIKQREYQDEIVSFFLSEDSLLKLTVDNFDFKEELSLGSEIKIISENTNLITDNDSNNNNHKFNEDGNSSNRVYESESIMMNYDNIIKNFDPSQCSLKKIKEKLHSKNSKLAIKQMLLKTKQDNSKLLVGINAINNNTTNSILQNNSTTNTVRVSSKLLDNIHSNSNVGNSNKNISENKIRNNMNIFVGNIEYKENSILNKKKSIN